MSFWQVWRGPGRSAGALAAALILSTAATALPVTRAAASVGDSWALRRRLPHVTQHAGATVLRRRLYVVGGEDEHIPLSTVQRYDPGSDTWRRRAPLPARRSSPGVVAADGRVFAIGGTSGSLRPSRSVFRYNPTTDRWGSRALLPIALTGVAAAEASANGHDTIFVFGGVDTRGRERATGSAYDTATDTWTSVAPLPVALGEASAVRVGGAIYVMGGVDGTGAASSAVFAYDVGGDTWTTRAPMRSNDFGPIGAVLGRDGRVYAIGLDWGARRVDAYDPTTDAWATSPPNLRHAQAFPAVGRIGRRIYAAGGNPGSLTLSSATLESLRVT